MSFDGNFLIIGHRGAAGLAPENTMKAFRRAFACGVDAVELDVHALDSRLVVIHDSTVDRTTNGRGSVSGFSIAELKHLDAGDGEAIPLLEEVVEALPEGVGLNIELKGPGTDKLVAAVSHYRANTLVSSRDLRRLAAFRRARPDAMCAPVFRFPYRDMAGAARAIDAWSVNIRNDIATPRRIGRLRDAGFRVLVFTVNDRQRALELARQGVSGVFTDFPDRVGLSTAEA